MRVINRNVSIFSLAGLVILVALGSKQICLSRDSASGDLLSNREEAYLFIGVASRGYRMNYFQYLGALLMEKLGGSLREPDDEHRATVVLHITPQKVERYVLGDSNFDLYSSFHDAIYANHQGQVWKWSETHFITVSQAEAQSFQEAHGSSKTNSDGWSMQVNILNRKIGEINFPLQLSGKILVVTVAPLASEVSIDLASTNGSTSRLWHLDEKTRRVNRSEYGSLFQNR
jgi:hypothetical protein